MNSKLFEIVGWYGTVAIVMAYALSSFNVIDSQSITYQLLNLTGAIAIVVLCVNKKIYQPAVLNIVWTLIALIAIMKIVFNI
jgi:hypothetical protein